MARKSNRRQTFTYADPMATSVQLVGDFTHWQDEPIEMEKQKSGEWKISVVLEPGTYQYRFIVDGEWRGDPDCELRVANPYGSQNAMRSVA